MDRGVELVQRVQLTTVSRKERRFSPPCAKMTTQAGVCVCVYTCTHMCLSSAHTKEHELLPSFLLSIRPCARH